MATGASTADLAVILIDARKGVLTQTRRHAFICSLLGIRHVVLAVNKIDLVDFDAGRLRPHRRRLHGLRRRPRLHLDRADPDVGALRRQRHRAARATRPGITARRCSSISRPSTSRATPSTSRSAFRCNGSTGPNLDFRGFAGTVASGAIAAGRRDRGRGLRQDLARSRASSPMTATWPTRRGRRCRHAHPRRRDRHRAAAMCWSRADRAAGGLRPVRRPPHLDGRGAAAARAAPICCGSAPRPCRRRSPTIKHKIDVNTPEHLAAKTLGLNEIGFCNISTALPIAFDPYAREPRDRRLHPDRPLHQPHGRRRHDRISACGAPPTSTGRRC